MTISAARPRESDGSAERSPPRAHGPPARTRGMLAGCGRSPTRRGCRGRRRPRSSPRPSRRRGPPPRTSRRRPRAPARPARTSSASSMPSISGNDCGSSDRWRVTAASCSRSNSIELSIASAARRARSRTSWTSTGAVAAPRLGGDDRNRAEGPPADGERGDDRRLQSKFTHQLQVPVVSCRGFEQLVGDVRVDLRLAGPQDARQPLVARGRGRVHLAKTKRSLPLRRVLVRHGRSPERPSLSSSSMLHQSAMRSTTRSANRASVTVQLQGLTQQFACLRQQLELPGRPLFRLAQPGALERVRRPLGNGGHERLHLGIEGPGAPRSSARACRTSPLGGQRHDGQAVEADSLVEDHRVAARHLVRGGEPHGLAGTDDLGYRNVRIQREAAPGRQALLAVTERARSAPRGLRLRRSQPTVAASASAPFTACSSNSSTALSTST